MVVGVATLAVLIAAGIGAYAATTSGGARYRTVVVTNTPIDQVLTEVGTATPAASANNAFGASGTVASVTVKEGQQVVAGQTLATLDTTSLNSSLASAEQTLADAKLTLEDDETGQTQSQSSSSRSSGAALTAYVLPAATPAASAKATGSSQLTNAENGVTKAQSNLDKAVDAVTTALTDCVASSASCPDAQELQTLQGDITGSRTALLNAEKKLNAVAAQLEASASTKASGGSTGGATGGSSKSGTSAGTSTTKVASAAQLAADQAQIDAAAAAVTVAEQDLARATLTSTTSGTVLSVGITAGNTVSANSSTETIVVADPSAYTFGITVPVTALETLKIGDAATVVPDGTSKNLVGKVTKIAVAPTSTGGSSYAVTIGLDDHPAGLRDGVSAGVTVTTASIASAVSVPTSALSLSGTRYTVKVLENGKVTTKAVTVGASGTSFTQVTSGLKTGQTVVLADLKAALPSSNTNSRNTGLGTGLSTGLGGGGLGGGTGRFVGGGAGGGFTARN